MTLVLPPVIAHRGACAYAPENTLAAFSQVKQYGTDWIEFDVMLTADEEVIVIHDTNLKRTTNGKGEVAEKTYAELETLDAGSWFGEAFVGEKIPRFVDVVDCLAEHQLGANIEIKAYPGKEVETAIKTVHLIQEHWPEHLPPPLVSSFSLESLYVARAADENLMLGLLLEHWRGDWTSLAKELQCVSVHIDQKIASQELIQTIQKTDRLALAYTVNSRRRAQQLFSWGIDAVFSDNPDIILAAIATHEEAS